jgi:predicted small metal-binding protein
MAYEFRCRDADHICGWKGRAATEEELLAKLADHVQRVHDVKTVTDTIVNYAKLKVRRV